MSVKALSWAFAQPLGGNEKVVLLCLADWARDDGACWPGQSTIAGKACVSEKTVSRIMVRLAEAGFLQREERRRPDGSRTSDLIRLSVDQADNMSPDRSPSTKQTPSHARGTEPSEEPSEALVARARAKPISYRGKRVDAAIVQSAERLLGAFNEATGRKLGMRALDGSASPYLRQIVGALLTRPEVTHEQWEAGIRNTAANPPGWTEGRQLQTGDVFGERAADHALANGGVPSRNGRRSGATVDELQALKGTLG